jgi:hypothetical protein
MGTDRWMGEVLTLLFVFMGLSDVKNVSYPPKILSEY